MTPAQLLASIQDGSTPPGNLVEVNWEEYDNIRDTANAFECTAAVTLLWQGAREEGNKSQTQSWIRARTSTESPLKAVK